jgi:Cu/Ag efflux protein CusF
MRLAAIVAILFWIACAPAPHEAKPVSEEGEKVYTLKGTIVGRDTSENTLRVDHETVPGVMDAMTMSYTVRGATVASLPPDKSRVEAKLHVADDRYWLSDIRKVQ